MNDFIITISNDEQKLISSTETDKSALKYAYEQMISNLSNISNNELQYVLHRLTLDGEPIEPDPNKAYFCLTLNKHELHGHFDGKNALYLNNHIFLNISIDSNKKIKSDIKLSYGSKNYSGATESKACPGKFLPMIDLEFDLICGSDNDKHTLKIQIISIITAISDESSLCNKAKKIYKQSLHSVDENHIFEYFTNLSSARWTKTGKSCCYMLPDQPNSLLVKQYASDNDASCVLKYLTQHRLGVLIFAYAVFSINRKFLENREYQSFILNLDYPSQMKDVTNYIKSIVYAFWKPNKEDSRGVSNFCINRAFNITNCLRLISNTHCDKRNFKHFPVFLCDAYTNEDVLGNARIKVHDIRLSKHQLDPLLKSDISFITLNAKNDDEHILQYDCRSDFLMQCGIGDGITEKIRKLVHDYIAYIESNINSTVIISAKSKTVTTLHNELHNEFATNGFEEFLEYLRNEINNISIDDSQDTIDEYVNFCRFVNFSDVVQLYKHKDIVDAMDKKDHAKIKKLFNTFKRRIANMKSNNHDTDFEFLYDIKTYRYAKAIENDYDTTTEDEYFSSNKIDTTLYESIIKKRLKEFKSKLKQKFEKFSEKYRYGLIVKFANNAGFKFPYYKAEIEAANELLATKYANCCAELRNDYAYILASMLHFNNYLKNRFNIPEELMTSFTKKINSMPDYLYIAKKPKTIDFELMTKLFCDFISEGFDLSLPIHQKTEVGSYIELYSPNCAESDNKKELIGWIVSNNHNILKLQKETIASHSPVFIEF